MTVLKPRSRSISVRLSEEEFSALLELCSESGARSVSDFTRAAVCNAVKGASREDVIHSDMKLVRGRMRILEKRIRQLTAEIAAFNPGGAH